MIAIMKTKTKEQLEDIAYTAKISEIKLKRAMNRIEELEDMNRVLLAKVDTCNTVIEREFEFSQQKKYEIKQLKEELVRVTDKHKKATHHVYAHSKTNAILKETLKNNLIYFDHADHYYYKRKNAGQAFNVFPLQKWEAYYKVAIENMLEIENL